jgi:hypothetical protein
MKADQLVVSIQRSPVCHVIGRTEYPEGDPVFPGIYQFHRRFYLPGDHGSFHGIMSVSAPAKAPPHARQVNINLVQGHAQPGCHCLLSKFRSLQGSGQLRPFLRHMGKKVVGLHGDMRQEGSGIAAFNDLRRILKSLFRIAVSAHFSSRAWQP